MWPPDRDRRPAPPPGYPLRTFRLRPPPVGLSGQSTAPWTAEIAPRLANVVVRMAHLGRHLPSEHHVEFRKAEDKHIVLVDEPDLDGIAEGVRKNRRQLEAAETD